MAERNAQGPLIQKNETTGQPFASFMTLRKVTSFFEILVSCPKEKSCPFASQYDGVNQVRLYMDKFLLHSETLTTNAAIFPLHYCQI